MPRPIKTPAVITSITAQFFFDNPFTKRKKIARTVSGFLRVITPTLIAPPAQHTAPVTNPEEIYAPTTTPDYDSINPAVVCDLSSNGWIHRIHGPAGLSSEGRLDAACSHAY